MRFVREVIIFTFIVLCTAVLLLNDTPMEYLKAQVYTMGFFSYVAFVLILVLAVVFMPLTVVPLIPMATALFGPLVTALLSVAGWTMGAGIAFLLARYIGKPLLQRYISLEKLEAVEATIPPQSHFWVVVLLRLTMPVDIVSYALGMTKSLAFTSYIAGTFVGVSWFSFAFAYMGDALFTNNRILLLQLVIASSIIFLLAWYILRVQQRDK